MLPVIPFQIQLNNNINGLQQIYGGPPPSGQNQLIQWCNALDQHVQQSFPVWSQINIQNVLLSLNTLVESTDQMTGSARIIQVANIAKIFDQMDLIFNPYPNSKYPPPGLTIPNALGRPMKRKVSGSNPAQYYLIYGRVLEYCGLISNPGNNHIQKYSFFFLGKNKLIFSIFFQKKSKNINILFFKNNYINFGDLLLKKRLKCNFLS